MQIRHFLNRILGAIAVDDINFFNQKNALTLQRKLNQAANLSASVTHRTV